MNDDRAIYGRGAYNREYDPSERIAEAKRRIAEERKTAEEALRARRAGRDTDDLEDEAHPYPIQGDTAA